MNVGGGSLAEARPVRVTEHVDLPQDSDAIPIDDAQTTAFIFAFL
jgi:hypothetical protein